MLGGAFSMPFRLDPDNRRCVQVRREGRWQRVDGGCHASVSEAEDHLAALRINVEAREKSRMDLATGSFSKLDEERQLAFGWAYVAQKGDDLVVDHSGDYIDKQALGDLEDAIYDFVLVSREADEMHERTEGVGKLVESVLFTPDKMEKMGLQGDRIGWWVGFKVMDGEVWQKVKDGTYPAFSIRGVGERDEEGE